MIKKYKTRGKPRGADGDEGEDEGQAGDKDQLGEGGADKVKTFCRSSLIETDDCLIK